LIEERRAASRAAWTGSGDTAMPVAVRAWSQPAQHMPDSFPRVSFASAFSNPNHQKQFSVEEQLAVQVTFDNLAHAEKKWTVAAKLTDVVRAEKPADDTKAASVWINIDANPFYAQGGGQVGDRGFLQIVAPGHVADGARFAVLDTQKAGNGIALLMSDTSTYVNESDIHETFATLQPLVGKATVLAIVDGQRRHATAVHHSATHLLQAALRQVLGAHITQAGSRVAPEHLRFDYTHSKAVTPAELAAVEAAVNNMCLSAIPSNIQQTSHSDAVNRFDFQSFLAFGFLIY
jgi:alanyl-tRNA synthetase